MKQETPTSVLAAYFMASCYTKAMVSKTGSYSSKHSYTRTLSDERQKHLPQTEEVVHKIKDCAHKYQMQTLIRKQPVEVQYFVFERAMVINVASQYDHRLSIDNDVSGGHLISYGMFLLLSKLWEEHLKRLSVDELDLDTHVSHILHGHL